MVGEDEGQGVARVAQKVFNPEEESKDLGFGSVLSSKRGLRLLNRNGTFNVDRREVQWWARFSSYQSLIRMRWPHFFAWVCGYYLIANVIFAVLYMACGADALRGDLGTKEFARAFFFSVDTFATIGYGNITPMGLVPNMLVTFESLVGLLSVALVTGLLFARFSRPRMEIEYSRNAVVAPYRGITGFMFRIVNRRDTQLIEVKANVVFSRFEQEEGVRIRRFHSLRLERPSVAFFPLAWTVVHPIDEDSPLWGWTHEQLLEAQAEYLVLLTGTDETFSETVHSRSSYTEEEVVWGAKFAPIFKDDAKHRPTLDWERFHAVERVPLADAVLQGR